MVLVSMDSKESRKSAEYFAIRYRRQSKRLGAWIVWIGATTAVQTPAHAAEIYETLGDNNVTHYTNHPISSSSNLVAELTSFASETTSKDKEQVRVHAGRSAAMHMDIAKIVATLCKRYDVPQALVSAVIEVESDYDPLATSAKGARGIMQLMPATGRSYGLVEPFNVEQNISAGVRHLKKLIDRYDGNVPLVLAAYNSGEGTIQRNGTRIPPYRETMLYVSAVLARMDAYQQENLRHE